MFSESLGQLRAREWLRQNSKEQLSQLESSGLPCELSWFSTQLQSRSNENFTSLLMASLSQEVHQAERVLVPSPEPERSKYSPVSREKAGA